MRHLGTVQSVGHISKKASVIQQICKVLQNLHGLGKFSLIVEITKLQKSIPAQHYAEFSLILTSAVDDEQRIAVLHT